MLEIPVFENWAQYTRAARSFIPAALDYDETWTQSALASLLGVDPNYVSMVERGDREPGRQYQLTLSYLIQMARSGLDPRST
jgi:helix-turn-helix protein